jgi:hypothetical protein
LLAERSDDILELPQPIGPTMRFTLSLALSFIVASPLAADEVRLTRNEHTVKINIGDDVFAVYNLGEGYPKPFLFPVAAPGGIERLQAELHQPVEDEYAPGNRVFVAQEEAQLKTDREAASAAFGAILEISEVELPWLKVKDTETWINRADVIPLKAMVTRIVDLDPPAGLERNHPGYYDHPHHKGVWLSIDEVNGIEFWAEKGMIRNTGLEASEQPDGSAQLQLTNHWIGEGNEPLVLEHTTLTVYPNRLVAYDIEFEAADKPVTFGDTKEGLFAIRLPNSMREFISQAPVVNNEGVAGTAELWGKPAPWIDYTGPIAGQTYGVTLMDDPDNFRPSRYHVRDYGLFAINPFGENAYTGGTEEEKPVTLQPGEKLKLRYGLYVHAGGTEEANVSGAYKQFTGGQ